MLKISTHLCIIIIEVVSVHLFPENTTEYDPNNVEFDCSSYYNGSEETSDITSELYNDYMEFDYKMSESEETNGSLESSNNSSTELRPNATNEFEQKLLDADIFGDVIHAMPEKCLKVTMNHGDLIPGQRLTLLQAWDQPSIAYEADPEHLHTLFLSCYSKYVLFSSESESENNSPHLKTEYAKWLVINIPGNNISAGQSLYNYTPPNRHHQEKVVDRYTFLLYKQQCKIRDEWLPDPENGDFYRPGEINQSYLFAQYYGLGNPVAANFFIMHW